MPELQAAPSKVDVQNIPVGKLQPNPWNRKSFEPKSLEELTNSIKSVGVLEPLIVREVHSAQAAVRSGQTANNELRSADYYEIASGNRRWLAAKAAGLADVPCQIRDLTDQQVAEMNITANIQKEDVPTLEMARMVKSYMDNFNKSPQEAADKFGKTREWVVQLQGFLGIDSQALDHVRALTLGWDQLAALKRLPAHQQQQVAQEVKDGTLQPHKVAKRCNQLRFSPKNSSVTPSISGISAPISDAEPTTPTPPTQTAKNTGVSVKNTQNNGSNGSSNPTGLIGKLGTAVQHQIVQHTFGSGEIGTVVEGWIAKAKGLKMWQVAMILPLLFFGLHFFWYLMNLPLHLMERASNRFIRSEAVASLPTGHAGLPTSTQPLVPSSNNSEPTVNSFASAGLTQIPAPTGIKAELVSGHRIHLSWTNMGPAYRYNIYSSGAGINNYHQENTEPTPKTDGFWSTQIRGKYDLVVTAVDQQNHESDYSEPMEVSY